MSAVQKIEPQAVVRNNAATPMEMLAQAIDRGMAPDVLDKLMVLADRWDKMNARKAFDVAIAAAKAKITVIPKNRTGHNNKRYADLAAIATVIDPILAEQGLSYRYRTVQDDKTIKVTCVLSHEAGHSEENTLCAAADQTGNKNPIQAIGSTLTYLQRYSLVQAVGLAAAEDDDGRATGNGAAINEEQVDHLRSLIVEVAADIQKFCKYMKVERIEDIPVAQFPNAVKALEAKRGAS